MLFAHYFLMDSGNAYEAAINSGYSVSTAKNAYKNIVEKRGFRKYIQSLTNTDAERKWIDKKIKANLCRIASGQAKKSHYMMHDAKDPTQSTEQVMIGPSATRDQVNSIDIYSKIRGWQYSSSKELEDAKSAKERSETKVENIKAKSANKIYKYKLILAKYQIRKTKAESEIKTIIAKENETNKNQTVSKLDEVLDAIFDNHDDQKKPK